MDRVTSNPNRGLLRPSVEQYDALVRLMRSPEWPVIKDWLEGSLKVLGGNACAEDYFARWAQGQGQAITEFIKQVETAAESLKRIADGRAAGDERPLIG